MKEVRCTFCGKLLFKSQKALEACKEGAEIEIKCKCSGINKFKTK